MSLYFGHVRGDIPDASVLGHDSGWQRYPVNAGIQICIGSNPNLYVYNVACTARLLSESSMADEDNNLMVHFPSEFDHGHWKRTPLAADVALDISLAFYNSKDTAPAKTKGKSFAHVDSNVARLEATARDGRKYSESMLSLRQDTARQFIIPLNNNRSTSIELSSLTVPSGDISTKKCKPYADVATRGLTDDSCGASNPFKPQRIQAQGFEPSKTTVGVWTGDDIPGKGLVFNNKLYHTVSKSTTNHNKVDKAIRNRLETVAPLQPRDKNGRSTDRSAIYPYYPNHFFHGPGHTARDGAILDTMLHGMPSDTWSHVFTGNPTKKKHQPVGMSVLGPPPCLSMMPMTPLARALLNPSIWRREYLATSWLLMPLLSSTADKKLAIEESINEALTFHQEQMVSRLKDEHLEKIKLFTDPEELRRLIGRHRKCSTISDSLLLGSEQILCHPKITQRAQQYHKKMRRKKYSYKK